MINETIKLVHSKQDYDPIISMYIINIYIHPSR
jgi:hypothetical protein